MRAVDALARLDARLLVCGQYAVGGVQGDPIPETRVQVEDSSSLLLESRIARKQPAAVVPGSNGVLAQPSPEGRFADRRPEPAFDHLPPYLGDAQPLEAAPLSSRSAPTCFSRTRISTRRQVRFVFEPLEGLARSVFPGWRDQQDWIQAVAGASVESDLAVPKRREHVAGELRHGCVIPIAAAPGASAEASAKRQDRWRRVPTMRRSLPSLYLASPTYSQRSMRHRHGEFKVGLPRGAPWARRPADCDARKGECQTQVLPETEQRVPAERSGLE